MKDISQFINREKGSDIYVLGSSPFIDYFSSDFFSNKITVGCNYMWRHKPCKYVVTKYPVCVDEMGKDGLGIPIMYPMVNFKGEKNIVPDLATSFCYNRDLSQHTGSKIPELLPDLTYLSTGSTVAIPAIHFAYRLGARNIILCGLECEWIDDKQHCDGYPYNPKSENINVYQIMKFQVNGFCDQLRQKGVGVYKLTI
jgi:hypothetical protein